jgi:hypothetical protein
MKLMAIRFVFFCTVLWICSCNDIFSEKEHNIKGRISVINPNNEEDRGYKLVFYEREFNSNVIEDYVSEIDGNDSLITVKAISKKDCETLYYEIKHEKGNLIKTVKQIPKDVYLRLISEAHLSNLFSDTDGQVCE